MAWKIFPQTFPNGHWATGWQERHVEKLQCFGFPRRRCRGLSANDGSRLDNHLTSGDIYPSLTQIHNDSYLITSLLVCFFDDHHTFPPMFPKVPLPLKRQARFSRQDLSYPTPWFTCWRPTRRTIKLVNCGSSAKLCFAEQWLRSTHLLV